MVGGGQTGVLRDERGGTWGEFMHDHKTLHTGAVFGPYGPQVRGTVREGVAGGRNGVNEVPRVDGIL